MSTISGFILRLDGVRQSLGCRAWKSMSGIGGQATGCPAKQAIAVLQGRACTPALATTMCEGYIAIPQQSGRMALMGTMAYRGFSLPQGTDQASSCTDRVSRASHPSPSVRLSDQASWSLSEIAQLSEDPFSSMCRLIGKMKYWA